MRDIDVIYDKDTNAIVGIKVEDVWVLNKQLRVMSFRKGAEPCIVNKEGQLILVENVLILKPEKG